MSQKDGQSAERCRKRVCQREKDGKKGHPKVNKGGVGDKNKAEKELKEKGKIKKQMHKCYAWTVSLWL